MAFEIYPRGHHRWSTRGISPTINCRSPRLALNKAAMELLQHPRRLLLLWDIENQRAAVKACEADPRSYLVHRHTSQSQGTVSCPSFLSLTGLARAGSLAARWNADEGLLEWNIPAGDATAGGTSPDVEPGEASSSDRSKHKKRGLKTDEQTTK